MRLLIVGTLGGHITEAGRIAHARGARVTHAADVDQAMAALRAGKGADLAMVDVRCDIARFVKALEAERFCLPVAACGVETDAQAAVRAIKAGAREYVPLPPDAELIAAVLEAVSAEDDSMIASDPAMRAVIDMAQQIAPSEATVLITGESGTGKEVMARFIHNHSRRKDKAFVAVNCAAIPENLLESELFGHEKGAFTGAVQRRIGKFEEATGGTLLLDEISEMDPRLQAKLLRALQERVIDRVGGSAPVKVDVRILATSNRNLEKAVAEGQFREDLYFRLNVVNLRLPSLRERPRDIAQLAAHFIRKFCALNQLPEKTLADPAIERLLGHAWRGNVRELENTIHRAVLMTRDDQVGSDAIILSGQTLAPAFDTRPTAQAQPPAGAEPPLVGRTVAEVEQDLILNTLDHCLGNRTHAANILGISIRTLRNKLRQYADAGVAVPSAR